MGGGIWGEAVLRGAVLGGTTVIQVSTFFPQPFSSEVTSLLKFSSITSSMAGDYTCNIVFGSSVLTSNPATLAVEGTSQSQRWICTRSNHGTGFIHDPITPLGLYTIQSWHWIYTGSNHGTGFYTIQSWHRICGFI